jgi:hypothetical protein
VTVVDGFVPTPPPVADYGYIYRTTLRQDGETPLSGFTDGGASDG